MRKGLNLETTKIRAKFRNNIEIRSLVHDNDIVYKELNLETLLKLEICYMTMISYI